MAQKKEKYKVGSYGEPIFPDAELEMEVASLRRYRIKAELDEVGRFYERAVEDEKFVFSTWSEDPKAGRTFSIGVGPRCKTYDFVAIVVMVDPKTRKKQLPWIHILVTAPDPPPEPEPDAK